MNRKIGMYASLIVVTSVIGFALSMLMVLPFWSYFASLLIALGFVPMMSAYAFYAKNESKISAHTAVGFAIMYATIISLVYYAQITSVRIGNLTEQARDILDFERFGLFFNYDMLGYALMALSTFFGGLTIDGKSKVDKWLKVLLLIHGAFFIICLVMPLIGVFTPDMEGADWIGTAVLLSWCLYFIPIGVLSFFRFSAYRD